MVVEGTDGYTVCYLGKRGRMRDIHSLSTKELKTLISNYEKAEKTVGALWPLDDVKRELTSRNVGRQRNSKVHTIDTEWDGRTIDLPQHAVEIIARHVVSMVDELQTLKVAAVKFGESEDWPWNGFVLSFATYGGSNNWTKNVEPKVATLGWSRVAELTDDDRAALFQTVPNPRFLVRTAAALEAVFQSIKAEGGPKTVRERLARVADARTLISNLQQYPGIGPKYARNIAMDVHHHLIRNHFAFDHRLNAIVTEAVGGLPPYDVREAMMLRVATGIGVEAWDLDRVLYSRHTEIIDELRSISEKVTSKEGRPV